MAGERVHDLLRDLDAAWDTAAGVSAFGPRQRWITTCRNLDRPVDARRARYGELTVPWEQVSPAPAPPAPPSHR